MQFKNSSMIGDRQCTSSVRLFLLKLFSSKFISALFQKSNR